MLIQEPNQRQIDLAVQNGDDIIIHKSSFILKLLLHFNTFLTGVKPEYVTYKNEVYDNRNITIRPKEDKASTVTRDIPIYTCNTKLPYLKVKRLAGVIGTVDYLSFIIDEHLYQFDLSEIQAIIENVNTKYQIANEDKDSMDCIKVGTYKLNEFEKDSVKYTFKNGYCLNILLIKNTKTNKYKGYEYSLGLESEYQDTKELALNNLEDLIVTDIELLFKNKFCKIDNLIGKEVIGESTDVKF